MICAIITFATKTYNQKL